jgi:hypothetical protein
MAERDDWRVRAVSNFGVGEDLLVRMWGPGTQWGRGSDGGEEPEKNE